MKKIYIIGIALIVAIGLYFFLKPASDGFKDSAHEKYNTIASYIENSKEITDPDKGMLIIYFDSQPKFYYSYDERRIVNLLDELFDLLLQFNRYNDDGAKLVVKEAFIEVSHKFENLLK